MFARVYTCVLHVLRSLWLKPLAQALGSSPLGSRERSHFGSSGRHPRASRWVTPGRGRSEIEGFTSSLTQTRIVSYVSLANTLQAGSTSHLQEPAAVGVYIYSALKQKQTPYVKHAPLVCAALSLEPTPSLPVSQSPIAALPCHMKRTRIYMCKHICTYVCSRKKSQGEPACSVAGVLSSSVACASRTPELLSLNLCRFWIARPSSQY